MSPLTTSTTSFASTICFFILMHALQNTGCDDMEFTCIATVHPILTKENATGPVS